MKTYVLFNIIVFSAIAIIAAIFFLVYFLILKKRGTKIRPSVFVAVLLAAALGVSTAGNILCLAKYSQLLSYYDSNQVDFCAIEDPPLKSQLSIYEELLKADDILGYHKNSFEIEDFTITYYLRDYPEKGILPGFILYAEYAGENPDDIRWDGGHVMWLDHGEMTGDTHCFLEYHTTKLMVIGSISRNVDELFFDIYYQGVHPKPELEFTIPVEVEHIHYN